MPLRRAKLLEGEGPAGRCRDLGEDMGENTPGPKDVRLEEVRSGGRLGGCGSETSGLSVAADMLLGPCGLRDGGRLNRSAGIRLGTPRRGDAAVRHRVLLTALQCQGAPSAPT